MAIGDTNSTAQHTEESCPGQNKGRDWETLKRVMCDDLSQVSGPIAFLHQLAFATPILVSIRITQESGILHQLVNARRPLTITEIVTGVTGLSMKVDDTNDHFLDKRNLIVRHLRLLSALHFVDEIEAFTYQANAVTEALTSGLLSNTIPHVFDGFFGPSSTMTQAFESATRGNSLQAPKDGLSRPFQLATLSTGSSTFDYWQKHQPEQIQRLSEIMAQVKKIEVPWTKWLPIAIMDRLQQASSEQRIAVWVDVGGSLGQDINHFASVNPELDVRLVLQDLPSVIEEGRRRQVLDESAHTAHGAVEVWDKRIEAVPYSFFDPQPIQNTEVYFMHRVLHDWSDVECVEILGRLRDAMGPRSRILNCDKILPNKGCSIDAATVDMTMLMLHSGLERDEDMWTRLIAKVDGLRIRDFHHNPYVKGGADGMIEIVRTDFVE